MDDTSSPQSLFAVLYYLQKEPEYYSIVQIDHDYKDHLTPELDQKVRLNRLEKPPKPSSIDWLFSPPTSSTEDLYMVPNWGFREWEAVKPLRGYKFSFTTGKFVPIEPPSCSMGIGYVVNLGGHIYFMAYSSCSDIWKQSVFQCYDPDKNSWYDLEPLPLMGFTRFDAIVGTVVWGDNILFNVDHCYLCAYNVSRNKWYPVDIDNDLCLEIVEEAVVVGSTIYALTEPCYDLVLALSIEEEVKINGDLVVKCSLLSEISLVTKPGTEGISFEKDPTWKSNWHFVHLGNEYFCIVRSHIHLGSTSYQPIEVIYMKLLKREKSMIVMNHCVHKMNVEHTRAFVLTRCFSLPKDKTTALIDGKCLGFNFTPFHEEDYALKPVRNEKIVTLHKDFESETSKQLAIEASTIRIGDREAELLEKRLAGLGLVDHIRTQAVCCSSSGKNMLNNHDDAKMTAVDKMEEKGVQPRPPPPKEGP